MQNTSPNERHVRFETLVMPYMADVQRFVQAMTRETEQTKDIVSETLYRAYKNMDAVREELLHGGPMHPRPAQGARNHDPAQARQLQQAAARAR